MRKILGVLLLIIMNALPFIYNLNEYGLIKAIVLHLLFIIVGFIALGFIRLIAWLFEN